MHKWNGALFTHSLPTGLESIPEVSHVRPGTAVSFGLQSAGVERDGKNMMVRSAAIYVFNVMERVCQPRCYGAVGSDSYCFSAAGSG